MRDGMGSTSSSDRPFLGASFLNSSASPSTRFMCLSKAINLQQAACGVNEPDDMCSSSFKHG